MARADLGPHPRAESELTASFLGSRGADPAAPSPASNTQPRQFRSDARVGTPSGDAPRHRLPLGVVVGRTARRGARALGRGGPGRPGRNRPGGPGRGASDRRASPAWTLTCSRSAHGGCSSASRTRPGSEPLPRTRRTSRSWSWWTPGTWTRRSLRRSSRASRRSSCSTSTGGVRTRWIGTRVDGPSTSSIDERVEAFFRPRRTLVDRALGTERWFSGSVLESSVTELARAYRAQGFHGVDVAIERFDWGDEKRTVVPEVRVVEGVRRVVRGASVEGSAGRGRGRRPDARGSGASVDAARLGPARACGRGAPR